MKLQAILHLSSRAATAVRRIVFSLCTLLWKAILLCLITMAVALTALAFNAALFVYRKLCDRWTATVRAFFETYFYAELRERCSTLEGRFDEVHGQIDQLKEELEGAAETQKAAQERTLQRLDQLNQVMAEGNALLEKIASKEVAYGFVGTFHHHHHHQEGDGSSEERLQLLTPPPTANLMFSSLPIDGRGSRGSCAFYGSEDSYPLSTSPVGLSTMSNCVPPPPPPPPPPPNFTFEKVSFKSTPRGTSQQSTAVATSTAVQTAKFVVSELEIAAMRNKLKKVPAKPNKIEKEDS